MKVLQVVSSAKISGAEKHVILLANHLTQLGIDSPVVCPSGAWVAQQLRANGLAAEERAMGGSAWVKAALKLRSRVKAEKIEVLHAHLTRAAYCCWLLGKMERIPVVSTVHVRSKDPVYVKLLPRGRNCIISVSNWVQQAFIEAGVKPKHLATVYNGTEFIRDRAPDVDLRQDLGVPPHTKLVGCFAKVSKFKGQYLLAQVWSNVHKQTGAELLLVGPVTDEQKTEISQLAGPNGIHFLGARDDVQQLMEQVDIHVLASEYEACSMSIIEGMACGKPVIATHAGGNPELIREGETGLLIPRKEEALSKALRDLLKNPTLSNQIGMAAQAEAGQRFTAERMAQDVANLYANVVAK